MSTDILLTRLMSPALPTDPIPASVPVVLEAQLEGYFRKAVRQAGGYTFKLAPIEAGIPDRLVIWPTGIFRLVELKTETGVLSKIQIHWHEKILAYGVTVVVLRGREEVDEWIRSQVQ